MSIEYSDCFATYPLLSPCHLLFITVASSLGEKERKKENIVPMTIFLNINASLEQPAANEV